MTKLKKISHAIIFLVLPFGLKAQEAGIHFEKGLSWKQIQAKAKAEHKYIFVDCYATWCGPCKWMAANIFPQKRVADYYNLNFINVAIQMDQTAKDSPEIKNWYADAAGIATQYNIHSFPNYLFFSQNGRLVHRLIGTTKDADEFIFTGKDAQDPNRQYYSVIEQYKKHLGDSLYLQQAILQALKQEDRTHAILIGMDYFKSLKQPLKKDNIQFFANRPFILTGTKNAIFLFFVENSVRIDSIMHKKGFTARYLTNSIFKEHVLPLHDRQNTRLNWKEISEKLRNAYPTLGDDLVTNANESFEQLIKNDIYASAFTDKKPVPDFNWQTLKSSLNYKYPNYDLEYILLQLQVSYFQANKQWQQCGDIMYEILSQYGNKVDYFEGNTLIWYNVFLHAKEPKVLNEALRWLEKSLKVNQRPYMLDTYANLLYKTGQLQKALEFEQKALRCEEENGNGVKSDLLINFDKMRNQQPTWLDDTPVKVSQIKNN